MMRPEGLVFRMVSAESQPAASGATATVLTEAQTATTPDRVLLSAISWESLERLDEVLGDRARLIYLDGQLEIMVPLSEEHEESKNTLGQILEVYLRWKRIRFYGRGSTTLGLKQLGARKEPDESYCLGEHKSVPDLAIEVTVTSGGIEVLEIYKRVRVREVWFWEDGEISVYALSEMGSGTEDGAGYERVERSGLLPELDLGLVSRCTRMGDQYDAVNEFLRSLGIAL